MSEKERERLSNGRSQAETGEERVGRCWSWAGLGMGWLGTGAGAASPVVWTPPPHQYTSSPTSTLTRNAGNIFSPTDTLAKYNSSSFFSVQKMSIKIVPLVPAEEGGRWIWYWYSREGPGEKDVQTQRPHLSLQLEGK